MFIGEKKILIHKNTKNKIARWHCQKKAAISCFSKLSEFLVLGMNP